MKKTYLARVVPNNLVGTITLEVIWDEMVAELHEGDHFVTVDTQVDLKNYLSNGEE